MTAAGPGNNPGRPGRQERTLPRRTPAVWRVADYLMDHRAVGVCVAVACGAVSLGGLALQLGGAA